MLYKNSAGLFLKDYQTGDEGITLAGILIFGTEELIHAVLPHYRTDALLKRYNVDRYDIRVNLLDSYDRLTGFVIKHLNDPFYLDGDRRVSLRDKIFREVISNMLIHREFSNAYPAKFIIKKDSVLVENSNKAHMNGLIDSDNYSPFPKNPTIARFFKEIGLVDELGSGVRNINKYNLIYSGAEGIFEENDIFRTIIPLVSQATQQAGSNIKFYDEILEFCKTPRSRSEIQGLTKLKDRENFRRTILSPMVKLGVLKLTHPDKVRSPKQKYYTDYKSN